ncbi:pin2p [Saccharomyces arboricola H-6]|uniref:Pin2p n=1 Tax=Saccharomyces arboricola (strain H-6 / AS 2.3317 / CBS 10644) TaxID=1160507 RepID=J8PZ60_SACAR|nr:pin2p [Saccharomyces arboricola H-6]
MNVCKLKKIVPLFPRSSFTDGVVSTGKSFKSWDTCMDNKACKIIAIVGIVLASILVIWLIGGLLTCFRQGVTGIGQFVCWCCRCSGDRNKNNGMPVNEGFSRVNMGVAPPSTVIYQPIQQPENAYYRNDAKNDDAFYDEVKTPSNEVYELEEDFDLEKQKEKTKRKQKRQRNKEEHSPSRVVPLVYDEETIGNDSPQRQYDARNSFIQNAASTSTNNNTRHTPQSPIFDINDYGENYYYNNSNGNNGNNNNVQGNSYNAPTSDHRSPYPTDSYQPYQGYNPNQNERYY